MEIKIDGELLKKAVLVYGTRSQERMVIEEIAELLDALMKYHRERATIGNVNEEIADVLIMLGQLIYMLDPSSEEERSVEDWINYKLARLKDRLDKHQNKSINN